MNKCNSQSSLVSKLIRGSKKVSEVICAGQNLFLFRHACNVLPRLFLTDCLQPDFCLKICYVRIPASEIKSKENPSSPYCAFGFAARRLRARILTRGETLKEMYNDINHSRPRSQKEETNIYKTLKLNVHRAFIERDTAIHKLQSSLRIL